MTEISFEYWNKLASQTILISSLLAGFSITVIANFLVAELNTKLSKYIMISATLAACLFLISVFAMTGIIMMTTEGYPGKVVTQDDLLFPRITGALSFVFGIASLLTMISLAGWTKSRKMGIFTTVIGVLTFIFILTMLT
ncbi:hypothetical protein FLGE108171_13725 [Flavobacterium gelidilacus]|jgi:uncharacterized membrane protein YozB (DUF420 family)|uniref:hypothetical protein n=1 Tax=Flavobacterium gelidilacus TaxID=206041 RepID=UPI000409439E|nr:hypothetical protein [Flavobacterium gelidilacus]